ncbi:MAG: hypothetical protein ACREVI_00655 [Steroidobacteraceae bacterium]
MRSSISRTVVIAVVSGAMAAAYPGSALADDAARIGQLESEIQRLRTQLNEQNRRIQRLEALLESRQNGALIGTIPGRHEERATAGDSATLPWHAPESWNRISDGMTEPEVIAILGEPVAVESAGWLKTLFYRGAAPGLDSLSGHVNFRDGRVVAVSKPALRD